MPLDSTQQFASQKNYAAVEPLKNAKRTPDNDNSSMAGFFQDIYAHLDKQFEEERRECIEGGRVIGNLINGKLVMKPHPSGRGMIFLKPRSTRQSAKNSNYPLFPENSVTLQSKWAKARIGVAARHFSDGFRAEIQKTQLNRAMQFYFANIFTNHNEIRENLQAQMFGTYVWQFFYDTHLNQTKHLAPIIQNQTNVLLKGYGSCLQCGFEGEPEDFKKYDGGVMPQCPKCGSYKLSKMVAPMMANESRVVDAEIITQGDLSGELRDFPAVNYDIRGMAHNSSYFINKTRVPMRLVRQMMGGVEIEGSTSAEDWGLQVIENFSSPGTIEGNSAESLGYTAVGVEEATMIEMWLKPEWYIGYKLQKAEESISGTIPAGVPFEELFPNGLCIVGFNDLNMQVGIFEEESNVVGGVYFLRPFSGIGKGVNDAVDVARDLNEIHSMAMAGLKRYGGRGAFYAKKAVSEDDVQQLFNPTGLVPVDTSKVPGMRSIHDAIGQLDSPAVNQALPQYAIQLTNLMNVAFLTGDYAQGMVQNVDINTLGGQQLATAKAEEQKGVIFSNKAETREQAANKLTNLFAEHIRIPRYYGSTDQEKHARTKGLMLTGSDFPKDVKYDAIPGSILPKNYFEESNNIQNLVEKAGGLGGIVAAVREAPDILSWYADSMGVKIPMLDKDEPMLVSLVRVEEIKKLSFTIDDPNFIIQQNLSKPLHVRESQHVQKAQFISSLLDDDEVSDWNPVAKAAISQLIELHYQLEGEAVYRNEAIKQDSAFRLQANEAGFQQALMAPQQQQMAEQEQQQQIQSVAQDAIGREVDEQAKEREFERKLLEGEVAHQRQKELQQNQNNTK